MQCTHVGPQAGVPPLLKAVLVGGVWTGSVGPSPAVSWVELFELLKAADPGVGKQLDEPDVVLGDCLVGGVCVRAGGEVG